MLKLSGTAIHSDSREHVRELLAVSTESGLPASLRSKRAFLIQELGDIPEGFKHYLVFNNFRGPLPTDTIYSRLPEGFEYIGNRDVISFGSNGEVRTVFRAASPHNAILLTEQCNNYCLMCSQPPKDVDDSWLLRDAEQLLRLIPVTTKSLGITGGEPTLYGEGFVNLIWLAKNWLPQTALHVLSNGRLFADAAFADSYAEVKHPSLMVGIPLYSADPTRHDYVVQAKLAFDETIRGILNLKQRGQRVEIRVVLHKQTYEGLPQLAEFIARNLLFVDHVALMGLEMTGFTRANIPALLIDPIEYRNQLSAAVRTLAQVGIRTSIYNLPLCLINSDVEPYYVRSISDWKNEYAVECQPCSRKNECGGFFSSGIQYGYSKSISPFL